MATPNFKDIPDLTGTWVLVRCLYFIVSLTQVLILCLEPKAVDRPR
jgi:hypothetical protein